MAKVSATIDVEDDDGVGYHMRITGPVTREKIIGVFDAMNLRDLEQPDAKAPATVGGRIWEIINKEYPMGQFTSSNVLEKYEDEYRLPIKLSVISTYLARFASRGRIIRQRRGRGWSYEAAPSKKRPMSL